MNWQQLSDHGLLWVDRWCTYCVLRICNRFHMNGSVGQYLDIHFVLLEFEKGWSWWSVYFSFSILLRSRNPFSVVSEWVLLIGFGWISSFCDHAHLLMPRTFYGWGEGCIKTKIFGGVNHLFPLLSPFDAALWDTRRRATEMCCIFWMRNTAYSTGISSNQERREEVVIYFELQSCKADSWSRHLSIANVNVWSRSNILSVYLYLCVHPGISTFEERTTLQQSCDL